LKNGSLGVDTRTSGKNRRKIYRGVSYKGRPAWQAWFADGLAVDSATVRRWLMDGAVSARSVPPPVASLVIAAERVADILKMWEQPRGMLIADRMADVVVHQDATLNEI